MDEQDATVTSLLEGTPIGLQAGTGGSGVQSFQRPAVAAAPRPSAAAAPTPAPAPTAAPQDEASDPLIREYIDSMRHTRGLQAGQQAAIDRSQQMQVGAINEYAQGSQSDIRTALSRMQPIQRFEAQDVSQTAQSWLMAMTAVAGFVGGRGRNFATNAMTALGSGITGFVKGNAEQADRSLKEFKANSDAAIAVNDQQWKTLKAVLDNRAITFEQRMAMAKVVGAQYDNSITQEAANRGDIKTLAQLVEAQREGGRQAEMHTFKLTESAAKAVEHREKAQALHQANVENLGTGVVSQEHLDQMREHLNDPNLSPYDRATLKEAIKQAEQGGVAGRSASTIAADTEWFKATGTVPLPPASRSNRALATKNSQYRTYIQNRGNEELDAEGVSPAERQERWRVSKNMPGWMAKEGPRTMRLGMAVGHLDLLRELGEIRRSGNMRAFEDMRGRMMEQFGKNAGTNIDTARQIVGTEIINALASVGSGGQSERQLMAAGFSPNASQNQFFGAINTAQGLLAEALKGRNALARENGVSQDQFNRLLPSYVRERLEKAGERHTAPGGGPLKEPPESIRSQAVDAIRRGASRQQVIDHMHRKGWDTRGIP